MDDAMIRKRLTQSYARKHAGDFTDQQENLLAVINEWAEKGSTLPVSRWAVARQRWFDHGRALRFMLEHAELGALDFAKLDEFITEQLEQRGMRFAE
jgi:hypothetical protein